MQIHAIVLAGGDGNRFGGELPKQFVRLAGDPILLRTLRRLGSARLDQIVVVSHPRWLDETRALVTDADLPVVVLVVPGGDDAEREHAKRARGPECRRWRRRARPRCRPAPRAPRGHPAGDRARGVGPRGLDRHRDPQRRHARDRGRRGRRRDPRPGPVSPRPDAAGLPQGGAHAGVRRRRARGRPQRHGRLQPRAAPRARGPGDRGRGRRGQPQDHDPPRHRHGRPHAPDARARARPRSRGRRPRWWARASSSSAARTGSDERSPSRPCSSGRTPRWTGRRSGWTCATTRWWRPGSPPRLRASVASTMSCARPGCSGSGTSPRPHPRRSRRSSTST